MAMRSPRTNKHLITLRSHHNFNWITIPLQGKKVIGHLQKNAQHNRNTDNQVHRKSQQSKKVLVGT